MSLAVLIAAALAVAEPTPPTGVCQSAPRGRTITTPDHVSIFVRTVGSGRPVLVIPSLGRGGADFDRLARTLARRGYQTILPDPRGIGRSSGPPAKDLFDLAADDIAVIQTMCSGPVDVVGHAFGNRVARSVATIAPGRVKRVVLLAGGGEAQPTPRTLEALLGSVAQGSKPDAQRLADLRIAFFANGHDPSVWLTGWYPDAAAMQRKAGAATPTERWWKAGSGPVMLIQALEDVVAPPANAEALRRDLGERLTLVEMPHAGHAILPEQPRAVAAVIDAYLSGNRSEPELRAIVARTATAP